MGNSAESRALGLHGNMYDEFESQYAHVRRGKGVTMIWIHRWRSGYSTREFLADIRQNQSSAYFITMNETAGLDLIK